MQPVDLWRTPCSYRTAFPLTLILECGDEIARDSLQYARVLSPEIGHSPR